MTNTTQPHGSDESGYEKRARAGLIPFIFQPDGSIEYLMMISSDPKFGGPRPMISKGKIEDGETKLDAAIREASEELGFKIENSRGTLYEVADGRVELYSCAYDLAVFGVEVVDRYDFDKWCDETEYVQWFTLEDFIVEGRKDHIKYVQTLERLIKNA